ncbi:uncharacterized protein FIBRA_03660 [Fibroporia radiculosa]|uniref:DOMON domain-containing protein n=1 Tax=Fibroporia radiculosa TaxID=599839 RepID=J4GNL5_9APHY|nr:uncharacterized protein FIBRA_03660 [Fibroporia radiculosa]CCM01600.1 predicted protein [Fibroporia radiculosa]
MAAHAVCLVLAELVLGDIAPLAPGPGDIFAAGSDCTLKWSVDTSGTWKNVTIGTLYRFAFYKLDYFMLGADLMSGSDNNMSLVTRVAFDLDGTDPSLSPYIWTCPEVDPYSDIYFYQFTNGDDRAASSWTTRFTIASPSNTSAPPQYAQQPNGDPIPWGNGILVYSNSSGPSSKFSSDNPTSDENGACNPDDDTSAQDDSGESKSSSTVVHGRSTTVVRSEGSQDNNYGNVKDTPDTSSDTPKSSHHHATGEHERTHSMDSTVGPDRKPSLTHAEKVQASNTATPSTTDANDANVTGAADSPGSDDSGTGGSDGSDSKYSNSSGDGSGDDSSTSSADSGSDNDNGSSSDGSGDDDSGNGDSSDDDNGSTMTSIFMTSSRNEKPATTHSVSRTKSEHATRRTLAPTANLPAKEAKAAQPAWTGSSSNTAMASSNTSRSEFNGTNGANLASADAPRIRSSLGPTWVYALFAIVWVPIL